MCLLVVCEPNSIPKADDLHSGACSNPHGFGFAIVADGKIISERSMSAKKNIARFLELRAQYPDGYAMWHARYATHGVKNEENCHPFKVGGSELTYLAHNGVLDVTIPSGDKRSDTRILAEDILPKIGGISSLDDDTIWTMVSKWAGGSKIAIINLDPVAKHPFYLINENLGTWDDDGIWWSNSSHKRVQHKPAVTTQYKYEPYEPYWIADRNSFADEAYDSYDFCPNCLELTDLDDNPYVCTQCKVCFDCNAPVLECLCYTPESSLPWAYQGSFDM